MKEIESDVVVEPSNAAGLVQHEYHVHVGVTHCNKIVTDMKVL